MYCKIVLLYLLFHALLYASSGLQIQQTVEQSCHVITDQGELDLTHLANKTDAAFSYNDVADQTVIKWNPCYDVTPKGCQIAGELFLIATESDGKVSGDPSSCSPLATRTQSMFVVKNGNLSLAYTSPEPGVLLEIDFICDEKREKTEFKPAANDQGLICSVTGKSVCLKKGGSISAGSVLIIIVVVVALLYVVVGVLVMKFVKKAQGPELCPNIDFWKGLPSLVKDGARFAVTCGRKSGYQDI